MPVRPMLLAFMVMLSLPVSAGSFYKWVDAQGVTHYSAEPPPSARAQSVDVQVQSFGGATELARQKPVVLYSAQWCGVCKRAKAWFGMNNIRYTEYDIETSAKGRNDFRRLGGRGVPLILVGEQRMSGFSPEGFERLMKQ